MSSLIHRTTNTNRPLNYLVTFSLWRKTFLDWTEKSGTSLSSKANKNTDTLGVGRTPCGEKQSPKPCKWLDVCEWITVYPDPLEFHQCSAIWQAATGHYSLSREFPHLNPWNSLLKLTLTHTLSTLLFSFTSVQVHKLSDAHNDAAAGPPVPKSQIIPLVYNKQDSSSPPWIDSMGNTAPRKVNFNARKQHLCWKTRTSSCHF